MTTLRKRTFVLAVFAMSALGMLSGCIYVPTPPF